MAPRLLLALPGSWTEVLLNDPTGVETLLGLVAEEQGEAAATDLRERLDRLTADGGHSVWFRLGTSTPTVLTVAWPPPLDTAPATPGALVEALVEASGRAAGEVREIPRSDGYLAVAEDRVLEGDRRETTYWVCRVDSARVLILDVVVQATSADLDEAAGLYRLLASNVTWIEPDGEAA